MTLEALADPVWVKGAIRRIADESGVHPEALHSWVKKAQIDGGLRPGTAADEAQQIKVLEKDVRELRRGACPVFCVSVLQVGVDSVGVRGGGAGPGGLPGVF